MKKEAEFERRKMVLAMEYIARQINDEELFELWLMDGVADGDIRYGSFDVSEVDEYYIEDEHFRDLMRLFLKLMRKALKDDSGLYCGDIVS